MARGARLTDGKKSKAQPPSDRLAKIIARNTRPHWSKSPVVRAVVIAIVVIVSIVLATCTDLGKPEVKAKPKASHVDGVFLR